MKAKKMAREKDAETKTPTVRKKEGFWSKTKNTCSS